MNSSSPRFNFHIFGIPAVCWVQSAGIIGFRFSRWKEHEYCNCDANGNAWHEYTLAEFRYAFGTCFCGDLTISDLLPA
jgi:hypothetical protein